MVMADLHVSYLVDAMFDCHLIGVVIILSPQKFTLVM